MQASLEEKHGKFKSKLSTLQGVDDEHLSGHNLNSSSLLHIDKKMDEKKNNNIVNLPFFIPI